MIDIFVDNLALLSVSIRNLQQKKKRDSSVRE